MANSQDEVSQGAALEDEHSAVLSRFDAMLHVPANGVRMSCQLLLLIRLLAQPICVAILTLND